LRRCTGPDAGQTACANADGSERYLVDEALLGSLTERMGALAHPPKTMIVQNLRAMATWVLRKRV